MVHECFYMPVCEKGWETLLYCVPQSRRWFNSFLHHSRCVLSAGWNRATSSAPKAGNLVPHLLLREPSHKNEGGRARVCLDLCKPSPPRKGGVPSRVQISFLICTYEGQELPIHGRQSIKSGSQSAFYFSLCWVLFPLKKKIFYLSCRVTCILYWCCDDIFFEGELPVLEMSRLEESAIMSLWDNDMCV